MRTHPPITCPCCGREDIPVYELAVPKGREDSQMGAIHLAAHDCPKGGDNLMIQCAVVFIAPCA